MSRFLILLYGVLCYAIGMGALVLVILFTVGIVSPWTVDTGTQGPMATALIVDAGLIALFGLQHSIMARPGFKAAITKLVPEPAERATYLIFTAIVSVVMLAYWRPIPAQIWHVDSETWRIALYAIALAGWGFTAFSSFLTSHWELFGLRQVWLNWVKVAHTPVAMKAPALYRLVRHPMMLGILVAVWVTPEMTGGHLLMAIGFTVYILIGIRYEERDLIKEYGASYEDYRARTPGLCPFTGGSKS